MRYKILLKPLEPFFFGSEQTFGKLGDKEYGSYIAVSEYFPNQTALLGMLKKEILKSQGLLTRKIRGEWIDKDKKNDAANITGNQRFSFETKSPLNYGKLKSIEPLFLQKDNEEYVVANDIFKYEIELNPPLLKGFSAKEGIKLKLFSKDFSKSVSISEAFKQKEQVGNKKLNTAGESIKKDEKDNAFFKKKSFFLDDGFLFGFYANVEDGPDLKELHERIVFLGADRGKFLMRVEECSNTKEPKLPTREFDYILLLSDSYIEVPLKENCDFAVTNETSFAFLKTKFENRKRKFKKSKRYYFYQKGSIIINPKEELLKAIESFENLKQVGYNRYIKLKRGQQ